MIKHFSEVYNWDIQYVSAPWNELLGSLEKGDIDILPAVGFTKERQTIFDFSNNPPYIDSGVLFAGKKLVLHTVFGLEGKRVAGVRRSIFTIGFLEYMKSFDIHCDMVLTECLGDQILLRQVWVNLLENAIKYTMPKSERQIEVTRHFENGMNVYCVKDSGVGFDSQYSAKLFDAFQCLHKEEEFEGMGIGLSIVSRIIKRHGGTVWTQGEIDKGATFFFTIPPFIPMDSK